MELEKFTYEDCRKMGFCSMSTDQDDLMLPIKYLDDYNKLKKAILAGEIPNVGENFGYLACMVNDLLANYLCKDREHTKKCLINISNYKHEMINCKIYRRLCLLQDTIVYDNIEYEKIKNHLFNDCVYIDKKCEHKNKDLILNYFNDYHCSLLSQGDVLLLIQKDSTIDIVKDTRFGEINLEDSKFGLIKRSKPKHGNNIRISIHNQTFGKTDLIELHTIPTYIKFNKCCCSFILENHDKNFKNIDPETISLVGCPNEIDGDFIISKIGLKSLKGGPKKVKGDYLANSNSLNSLDGAPYYVGGKFNLNNNNLTDDAIKKCIESQVEYNWKEVSIRNNPDLIRYRNPKNW